MMTSPFISSMGANIGNILNFEQAFPGATVIKLEQNYRSTQNILDAANAVIRNNRGRKEKTLWTANGEGDKIRFKQFDQSYEEADFIVKDIIAKGYPLMRTVQFSTGPMPSPVFFEGNALHTMYRTVWWEA